MELFILVVVSPERCLTYCMWFGSFIRAFRTTRHTAASSQTVCLMKIEFGRGTAKFWPKYAVKCDATGNDDDIALSTPWLLLRMAIICFALKFIVIVVIVASYRSCELAQLNQSDSSAIIKMACNGHRCRSVKFSMQM